MNTSRRAILEYSPAMVLMISVGLAVAMAMAAAITHEWRLS